MIEKISKSFFTGINYWASANAINMWEAFDAASIENDLRLMHGAGITHLRVFPLWSVFQPLKALYGPSAPWEYGFGEEPLPDTPAGRAGVSEEACRKFGLFCALAQKYGMKLIVALITGHMSFRTYTPPAFEGKSLLSDPTVIKWQLRFVKYFVERFRHEPCIAAWDLGNEPNQMPGHNNNPDAFYVWCSVISDAVKTKDSDHPVISGVDNSAIENGVPNYKTVREMCDIHTVHPYNIFQTASDPLPTMKPILDLPFRCRLGEDIGSIPTFIQEFGSIGYMNCSRKTEADFYRAALLTSLAHGCHGVMWWCAFDQGHLRYAPYRWNTIGSDYGFFDRELKPKPLVGENIRFREVLSAVPGGTLPKNTVNATVIVSRDDGGVSMDTLRAAYILAKQANMDVNFCYALDPIPDSPLYIFPSISSNKSISAERLDELTEKVKQGAVLYISSDSGLIRDIPQMTGVSIAYREKIDASRVMLWNGGRLPVYTRFLLKPEEILDASVLASDENGDGMFFRHAYGKGAIYFLTAPLEKHLAQVNGAFFKPNTPDYASVYRELAAAAGIRRTADCDNRFIRFTEHIIDENSLYLLAINYNNKPESARLTIHGDYELSVVFGDGYDGGSLHLRENDGILLRAVKRQ